MLDLFIRLWLAQSFFASGMVRPRAGIRPCCWATYEYPVAGSIRIPLRSPGLRSSYLPAADRPRPFHALLQRFRFHPVAGIEFAYKPLPENLFWALLFGLMMLRGRARCRSIAARPSRAVERASLPARAAVLKAVDRVGRSLVCSPNA